jgi:hypothetical protein
MLDIAIYLLSLGGDSLIHWLLAFSLGALVYCLTSTMFFVLFEIMAKRGRIISDRVAAIGIVLIPLLLCLSVAFLSHWGLDYWSVLYVKPLAPHLIPWDSVGGQSGALIIRRLYNS